MTNIRIGYACINTLLPSPNRTCRLERATPERLLDLARANLAALATILEWNAAHGVRLFRITSEVIPFASHPVNQLPWSEILQPELAEVAGLVQAGGMRVSMHPGQYTVLNSLRPEVVQNSIAELEYHARFLDSLGLDSSHKIVLHLGGVFGDKAASLERFAANSARLPENVLARLVLENDEKSYTLADALEAARQVDLPVVFDVFHHAWNLSFAGEGLRSLVERAAVTWRSQDGRPKLHYSDQWPGKPPGAHSQSVDVKAFKTFYQQIVDLEVDVMLEVKDKEQSVLALHAALPDLAA